MLNFLKLITIGDITKCRSPKNGREPHSVAASLQFKNAAAALW